MYKARVVLLYLLFNICVLKPQMGKKQAIATGEKHYYSLYKYIPKISHNILLPKWKR